MKRKFSPVLFVIVATVILMGGCAKTSNNQNNDESQLENKTSEVSDTQASSSKNLITSSKTSKETTTSENKNDIYIYKGIEFTGKYNFADYGNSFYLDKNSLQTEYGLKLSETSYNAAMSFIAADTEELFKYFNEDDVEKQLRYMEGWIKNKLNYLLSLTISVESTYFHDIENNDVAVLINYNAAFDYGDGDINAVWISITMYLADDGEWRVKNIDYTG